MNFSSWVFVDPAKQVSREMRDTLMLKLTVSVC